MYKRLFLVLGSIVTFVLLVVVANALTFSSRQIPTPPAAQKLEIRAGAENRLAESVRLKTISNHDRSKIDPAPFLAFHKQLQRDYPKVHATLQREVVAPHNLIYHWKGSDPSLKPILLMGHQDIVPVEGITMKRWTHDPFGGVIKDGFIWGRGTMDDKFMILSMLEATEALLGTGFIPKRSVYYAFGYDEEVSGTGARAMAKLFKERGLEFEYVMDEGNAIVVDIVPGTKKPVALIGVAEKGFLTVHLQTSSTGGHSSMPPKQSAVGVLARAVARVEDNKVPGALSGPLLSMFEYVGPEMDLGNKLVFSNLWLFRPVVTSILESKNSTNAILRTTTAVTQFSGSPQDNVLPKLATASINYRLHPRDSIDSINAHVERYKGDDRVTIDKTQQGFASNPSKVSSISNLGYKAIERSVREIWPDTLVAPSLTIGATDARHMQGVSENIFRFTPMILGPGDPDRIHGIDERIGVENYKQCIDFFVQLLRNSAGEQKL